VGDAISGLDAVGGSDLRVFHGATQLDAQQHVTTAGGRVLTVCALGADIGAARATAYRGVDAIDFAGKGYRRDIAHHALRR
jgi:phosphoribosylamine--glycine ligase